MPAPSSGPPDRPELKGRRLLVGVSGGIAAYKSAALVRLLKKAGAEVQVLMTHAAARFITPLTLGTLSEREVLTAIFPEGPAEGSAGSWTKHVSLGLWADLFIVAPATAQTVAKLANGFSDSMLTATALSARCPLLVCPSMDRDMYGHPAVTGNLRRLQDFGYAVMPAAEGELASGLTGPGRMPEPEAIFTRALELIESEGEGEREKGKRVSENVGGNEQTEVESNFHTPASSRTRAQPLRGKHVLVTAGPTREHLDPVRVLTNPSTGTMGYALAEAAVRRGARVTLVSGPTALSTPPGTEYIGVETADEMHAACLEHAREADLVLMAAAVADYTPTDPSSSKIKKTADNSLTLLLRRTPDILAALGQQKRNGQTLLGFALETDNGLGNARRKLEAKNLDWIVLNSLTEKGAGFGTETNRATLLGRDGSEDTFPLMSKRELAEEILERVA